MTGIRSVVVRIVVAPPLARSCCRPLGLPDGLDAPSLRGRRPCRHGSSWDSAARKDSSEAPNVVGQQRGHGLAWSTSNRAIGPKNVTPTLS